MALDLVAELEGIVDAFEARSVDYAICGAVALTIHGHPRATKDIDVLVRSGDLPRALDAARDAGFDLLGVPMTFGAGTDRERQVQRISKAVAGEKHLLQLDLLSVTPVFEAVWRDRWRVRWRDRVLSVVSRDGLATMKRVANRLQDRADVAKLEGHDDE